MKVAQPVLSKSDRDWRAEEDARTLAEARVIMADPKRHKAAVGAAAEMAEEKMVAAKAMKRVANCRKVRPETAGTKLRSE
jgi:hypothetical protein